MWRALAAGDPVADAEALAEDFLGLYASGFAGRAAHADQLTSGPAAEVYCFEEARVLPVGDDHALFCYRARFTRPDEKVERNWLISSLWRRIPGGWENVFSQDTAAAGTPGG